MIAVVAQYTINFTLGENGRFTDLASGFSNIDRTVLLTSDYSHILKKKKEPTALPADYDVVLIPTPPYRKNISLTRLRSCKVFARNVRQHLETLKDLKLVYCAVPTPDVGAQVAEFCKARNIPFVLDIQDLWPDAFYMALNIPIVSNILFAPMKKTADNLYRSTENLVAVSKTYIDRATKAVGHSAKRELVAFLGNSLKRFDAAVQTAEQGKEEAFTVGYIGTLSYSYDIKIVINAVSALQEKGKEVHLLVMGEGPLREDFERYAVQKNISVEFTGRLTYEEMVKRLVRCHVAVNPIVKGSAGSIINKVGDYAAAGLPVINSQECMEYRELVEKYRCGINCKNGSTEDFTDALFWMVNNPIEREEMGKNARIMAEALFDRDKSYSEIQKFVREIYESSDN